MMGVRMKHDRTESEREILEVERRLVARVERMERGWQDLRTSATRRYAIPALVAAAALGALTVGAAAMRGRRKPQLMRSRTADKPTLLAQVVALASLVGTLRRLPIGPLAGPVLEWMRSRRTRPDMKSRSSPISAARNTL